MKKRFLYCIICLCTLSSFAIYHSKDINPGLINDGPYIFRIHDTIKAKWIEKGILNEEWISKTNCATLNGKLMLSCQYEDLTKTFSQQTDYYQQYYNVDSIIAISDVHGHYNSYIQLLKVNGVIGNDLSWKFGKGHLVVIGDVFDRGEMVTEILWHLFCLEKQAARAGGMVHVLLGNHEGMLFSGDRRYLNEKYIQTEKLMNTSYIDLYDENSVLGEWLRSKPVMITIDDLIFVHAGISIEVVRRNHTVEEINKIFSERIIGKDKKTSNSDENLKFLNGKYGPIWYRGYFTDSTFSETTADSILRFYAKNHIIVGHSTNKEIKTFFHHKIFGIDAGLGNDQPGEMLLFKGGCFFKCSDAGDRTKF